MATCCCCCCCIARWRACSCCARLLLLRGLCALLLGPLLDLLLLLLLHRPLPGLLLLHARLLLLRGCASAWRRAAASSAGPAPASAGASANTNAVIHAFASVRFGWARLAATMKERLNMAIPSVLLFREPARAMETSCPGPKPVSRG
ncbi:hypothetical protein A8M77_29600 [Variovorax sp. JS1663]|nr:hypothetical protein A8M77_29600 [Variovorax sp. JS1663]